MMRKLVMVCALAILTGTAAASPSFQGFETETGDWYFYDGGVVSG